ncbi:MAG: hypothetical protein WCS42_13810, partial [Verrucomicrobiota bacterium]
MNNVFLILLLAASTCLGGNTFVGGKFVSGAMPFIPAPANGLLANITAYYPMDDSGAVSLEDVSGNSMEAPLGDGETLSCVGKINSSVDFNNNSYPCMTPMQFNGGDFTMNVWLKVYSSNYDPTILCGLDALGQGILIRDYCVSFMGADSYYLNGYPNGFYATLLHASPVHLDDDQELLVD